MNKQEQLSAAFKTEFKKYGYYLVSPEDNSLMSRDKAREEFNIISSQLCKLPFIGCTVELLQSFAIMVNLLFEGGVYLQVTKPLLIGNGLVDDSVVFTISEEDHEIIMQGYTSLSSIIDETESVLP